MAYLLQDEFTTDRAAGAVNGTAAEPGPGGNRTVTDANSKLTIASGLLSFATGGSGSGNPGLWYDALTRAAGLVLIGQLKDTGSTTNVAEVGWDSDTTVTLTEGFRLTTSGISILTQGIAALVVGTFTPGTDYVFVAVLRASGTAFFVKASTGNFYLLWMSSSGTGNLRPSLQTRGTAAVMTSDYIRVPVTTFLPTPLASDGFPTAFGTTDGTGHAETSGIGAGGSGLTWTGATWSVSGAKAINTPGVGSELLTDPGLEAWASATNLTNYTESIAGTSTANQETTGVHGGSNAIRMDIDASNNLVQISQTVTLPLGAWNLCSYWAKASATGKTMRVASSTAAYRNIDRDPGTTWTQFFEVGRCTSANPTVFFRSVAGTSGSVYFDDLSIKALTLADLFSSVSVSTADVVADVNVVVTSGTQAGLVLNLDSTSSPANFVIAYHDGINAKLEKCVAGVYTTVITAAVTYSAGATLRVTKIGTAYRLYYNNALVGSGTISDAGIISNTRHGLFSTYSANTLDNFVVYASGSGGEYATLDTLGQGGIVPLAMASYRRRRAA